MPAAELETGSFDRAYLPEPKALVEPHGSLMLSAATDAGDHLPKTCHFALLDQTREQRSPDAPSLRGRGDVDAVLDRKPVSRPRAVGAGISVTEHPHTVSRHEI